MTWNTNAKSHEVVAPIIATERSRLAVLTEAVGRRRKLYGAGSGAAPADAWGRDLHVVDEGLGF